MIQLSAKILSPNFKLFGKSFINLGKSAEGFPWFQPSPAVCWRARHSRRRWREVGTSCACCPPTRTTWSLCSAVWSTPMERDCTCTRASPTAITATTARASRARRTAGTAESPCTTLSPTTTESGPASLDSPQGSSRAASSSSIIKRVSILNIT